MIFSEDILARVAIFILAVCGFLVAKHIYKHKKANAKPLVCPIRFDCATVVHSDYSKLFGIPVEKLGMLYYALVAIGYLFLIFSPAALPENAILFLILLSLIAFLFSAYLIGIQIFVLKKGCSWCIVSAFICLSIFLVTVFTYDIESILRNLIQAVGA
ncbi:MAG: vitamin K epoxide reductase family protein [Candidatus Paceibacterota bacterium]